MKTKISMPSLILLLMFLIGASSYSQAFHYYLWWDKTYSSTGTNIDSAIAMVLDNSGNLYVTGASYGAGGYSDIATIKYNTNTGGIMWVSRYDYNSLTDRPTAIVADNNSGAVYVTGYSYTALPYNRDFITIKYDPATGDTVWTRRYNGAANGGDESYAIGIDNSGNVFITGNSDQGTTTADIVTIKYTPSGSETVNLIPLPNFQRPNALKLDASGNVYVTGLTRTGGNEANREDYITIKYDNSLAFQWSKIYNGNANGKDNATALTVDGSGNIYVTGFSYWAGQYYNYVTIKYGSNGDSLAAASYDGAIHDVDFPTAIEIDNNSNIIVTGYSLESAPPTYIYDYATIKYNSSLSQQWAVRYDGTGNGDNKAAALAVDNSGNVYVTGYSTGSLSSYDYLTIKYNSSGIVDTMLRINGNANMNGYASTIVIGPNSTIYVTGSAYFTGSGLDYYTLRYSLDPLLAVPLSNEVPEQFVLSQNYPNPFNPSTAIKFDIPKSSPVKLSVFDVTGREIEVLVNENLSAGSYSVSWDAGKVSSGIYFYRLTAGDFVQTKKMILVK